MLNDRIGICKACREWTSLAQPCCGAPVYIDGAWCEPDDDRDPADIDPEPRFSGGGYSDVRNENGSHK